MPENLFYQRRAKRLSRAELDAIETLKAAGWLAMSDVYIEDGTPEMGDGSPTYEFCSQDKGRYALAVLIGRDEFAKRVEPSEVEVESKPKKRGRPKKL